MILNEAFTLSNGVAIPKLGLGTWFIPDETVAQVVKYAVRPHRLLREKQNSCRSLFADRARRITQECSRHKNGRKIRR